MIMRSVLALVLFAACATDEPAAEDRPQLRIDCALPAACTTPITDSRTTYSSPFQVEKLVTGVWVSCTPPSPFHPDWRGLELRDNQGFSILVPDDAGHCVRGVGGEYEGKWWIEDVSEQNPAGTYQISLRWDDGATVGHIPQLSTSPRWMHDTGPVGTTWAAPYSTDAK